MTSLTLDLHQKQADVFLCPKRFKVVVCGRRFGKSRLALTKVIAKALSYQGPYDPASPPIVLCGMPTLKQARKIFWLPLVNSLHGTPLVKSINRSNYSISFHGNRPDIVVLGLNDAEGDGARGLRIYFAALDEFQAIKPGILDEVIIPAMSDTPGSAALITGTPKGKLNHLHSLKERAETNPTWAFFHFLTRDNPFIDRAEIEEARRTLPPRVFRQEYEASFEDFEGQIFSELTDENIIDDDAVPTEFDDTWLGHDPGDLHPALCVIGLKGRNYYILDIWEGDGINPTPAPTIEQKAVDLCRKHDVWRSYVDPSRPLVILDFRRRGKDDDVQGMRNCAEGYNKIEQGLMILNSLFFQNRLFIPKRFQKFIDQCRSYHRKTDKDGRILDEVESGQDDHAIDTMRYVLASLHSSGKKELRA